MRKLINAWRWLREEVENARKEGSLAPPYEILRRLVAFPFILALSALLCGVVWAGWGWTKALQTWEDIFSY